MPVYHGFQPCKLGRRKFGNGRCLTDKPLTPGKPFVIFFVTAPLLVVAAHERMLCGGYCGGKRGCIYEADFIHLNRFHSPPVFQQTSSNRPRQVLHHFSNCSKYFPASSRIMFMSGVLIKRTHNSSSVLPLLGWAAVYPLNIFQKFLVIKCPSIFICEINIIPFVHGH